MSKIRVLLVDDEEDYVNALADRMDLRDLQSQVALSGEEALLALNTAPPDVIVLDLRMPGMQGMEVLEKVRRDHPHIQVIILTGHGGEKEEKEARRLGAFEYFQKPADTGDLVDTIRGAWRRSLQAAKELMQESKDSFEDSMTAAALAEAGMPDAAEALISKPTPPVEKPPASEGIKVLLVDDEEDYVKTMAERMEMRDQGSNVALNGEDALKMLEDDVPDVMVLDLRMPGIGGLEVLEKVKKGFPAVEVIILTGHGSDKEEVEAKRLGAFDYLKKPVDIAELMEVIRRAGQAKQNVQA
jgi:DNA-binding NtrC family response regulator